MNAEVRNEEKRHAEIWWDLHRDKRMIAITPTMKPYVPVYDGRGRWTGKNQSVPIDEILATENLRHFTNRLDRVLSNKSRRKRTPIPKIFVMEQIDGKPHFHGIVALDRTVTNDVALERLIGESWSATSYGGNIQIDTFYENSDGDYGPIDFGWLSYITKFKDIDNDCICYQSTQL